jgi:hypothetical protein
VVGERRKSQALCIDEAAGLLGVSVDLMSRLENGQGSVRLDLPVSYKCERNLGSARPTMLRWALFQFLVGNTDAHGRAFRSSCGPAACWSLPTGMTWSR